MRLNGRLRTLSKLTKTTWKIGEYMKNAFWVIFLTVLSFVVVGCSSYPVTFNTNPPGALLVCGGVSRGYTPVTLYADFENDNYYMPECEAIWVSGARATYPTYWGDAVEQYPSGVQSTLQRPEYPDLDKDMQFALQVQQMKQQQTMQQQQMFQQQLDALNRNIQDQNRQIQESINKSQEYFRQQDQENYQNQMLYQMQNLNNNLNNLNRSLY